MPIERPPTNRIARGISRKSTIRSSREFLINHYTTLKNANPNLKLMVREAQNVLPKCYARYEYGKEAFVSLVDNTAEEILEKLKGLNRT